MVFKLYDFTWFRDRQTDRQSSKGNNSKSKQEFWFLHCTCCLMLIDIYMRFREDSLNSFQVMKRTRFCDRQTPGGKTICLPTLKGGDIITTSILFVYFFIKTYVVGIHLNCTDLSRQFKWVPKTYAFLKKIRKKNTKKTCISIIR